MCHLNCIRRILLTDTPNFFFGRRRRQSSIFLCHRFSALFEHGKRVVVRSHCTCAESNYMGGKSASGMTFTSYARRCRYETRDFHFVDDRLKQKKIEDRFRFLSVFRLWFQLARGGEFLPPRSRKLYWPNATCF